MRINKQLLTFSCLYLSLAAAPVTASEAKLTEHNDSSKSHIHQDHDSQKSEEKEHEDEHQHKEEQGHEEQSIDLSPTQLKLAGIQVKKLQAQKVSYEVYAPGEVHANGYTSFLVSPRHDSNVLKRHVTLGQHVEPGQPLVTLFSSDVAEIQASFEVAHSEWNRVKELGVKAVGEKRYVQARANYFAVKAKLTAAGFSDAEIQQLSVARPKQPGLYTLKSHIKGVVLSDNFEQGQRVAAGSTLIALANEQSVWVEARLPANQRLPLAMGTLARVVVGNAEFAAKVIQEAHTIDEQTRTRRVRLLVENTNHLIHPGQFAEVYFQFLTNQDVLAVPERALMRSADGDWTVYVEEHPGEFKALEVELGRDYGELKEIRRLKPGTPVVWQGAFYVASELAKSGFEIHNH